MKSIFKLSFITILCLCLLGCSGDAQVRLSKSLEDSMNRLSQTVNNVVTISNNAIVSKDSTNISGNSNSGFEYNTISNNTDTSGRPIRSSIRRKPASHPIVTENSNEYNRNTSVDNTLEVRTINSSRIAQNNITNNSHLGQINQINNLSSTSNEVIAINNQLNDTKSNILEFINMFKVLCPQLRNNTIKLDNNQINACNELISNLKINTNRINLTTNEVNNQVKGVRTALKNEDNADGLIAKYTTLINCLDNRLGYYNNCLSLLNKLQIILTKNGSLDKAINQNKSLDKNIIDDLLNDANKNTTNNQNIIQNSTKQNGYYCNDENCYIYDQDGNIIRTKVNNNVIEQKPKTTNNDDNKSQTQIPYNTSENTQNINPKSITNTTHSNKQELINDNNFIADNSYIRRPNRPTATNDKIRRPDKPTATNDTIITNDSINKPTVTNDTINKPQQNKTSIDQKEIVNQNVIDKNKEILDNNDKIINKNRDGIKRNIDTYKNPTFKKNTDSYKSEEIAYTTQNNQSEIISQTKSQTQTNNQSQINNSSINQNKSNKNISNQNIIKNTNERLKEIQDKKFLPSKHNTNKDITNSKKSDNNQDFYNNKKVINNNNNRNIKRDINKNNRNINDDKNTNNDNNISNNKNVNSNRQSVNRNIIRNRNNTSPRESVKQTKPAINKDIKTKDKDIYKDIKTKDIKAQIYTMQIAPESVSLMPKNRNQTNIFISNLLRVYDKQ